MAEINRKTSVLKEPIDTEAMKTANSLYQDYCTKVVCCNSGDKLPAPIHKVLCNLAVFRYTLSCTGHIEVLLNPSTSKPRDIEGFTKATIGSLQALAKTYPEYRDDLAFNKRSITKLFDAAKLMGNRIMSQKRTKDMIDNIFSIRKNNNEMNREVLAIFERIDKKYGTCYTPSNELLLAEKDACKALRATLVDIVERHSKRGKVVPQPMVATFDNDMSFLDMKIETDTRAFSEKTYLHLRAKAREARKYLNRSTVVGLQAGAIENTELSKESKDALVGLCSNRHNFHASGFAKLFLHPEDEDLPVVSNLLDSVERLSQDPALPDFTYDVHECILEMREIADEAKEKNYQEPYFLNCFTAFDEKKEELDAAIMTYLRSVDEAYGLKLTPKGISREGRDMFSKGLSMVHGMMNAEQRKKERAARIEER